MSDDSETVEDTEKGSLAEVTDDSHTVEFIEIVPLDGASDDYNTPEFIEPVAVISLEDLDYVQCESADESDNGYSNYSLTQELTDKFHTYEPCFTIPVHVRTTAYSQLIL